MRNMLAQIDIAPEGGFRGIGEGPLANPEGTGISTFSKFISSVVGLMTIIAIIWFVFTFFIGALGIITAGGDKQALESARKKIINGIIGLVVTIAAVFVVSLIGTLIGIPNILDLNALFDLIQ
jgi:hypothetical protein